MTSQDQTPVEDLSFEEAKTEIEDILTSMEQPNLPLEEAITLWERGEQLIAHCTTQLEAMQARVAKARAAIDKPA